MQSCKEVGCDLAHHARGWCSKHYARWHYEENKERLRIEALVRYHAKRDRNLENQKAWRQDNIEHIRRYRRENIEKFRESYRRNRESYYTRNANRRARLAKAEGSHTVGEWMALLDSHDYICFYCGEESFDLTRDHIIPISRGGSNSIDNILPACSECNSKKHNRTLEEYRPGLAAILAETSFVT